MKYQLNKEEALNVISNIRENIREYFRANGLKYAIFGKSEGLDSSVIAGILSGIKEIIPLGVLIPIESSPESEKIAKKVLDHYKIKSLRVDLTEEYKLLKQKLSNLENMLPILEKEREKFAYGNIKVRLRMITLYHIAQLTGGIVISTDNFSEFWTGFWTLNGDVGDLSPIQEIFKGEELYVLGKALGVPIDSLTAEPSDGLNITPNGTDKDQLLLDYKNLDEILINLIKKDFENQGQERQREIIIETEKITGFSNKEVSHIANKMKNSYYKRHWPKVIKREDIGLKALKDII